MSNRTDSLILRYGCAVVGIILATGVRLLFDPILEDKFVFTLLIFAVMFASWYGGFGPAVAATLLGALIAAQLFLAPRGSFAVEGFDNQMGLALYLAVSFGIALLGGAMRQAQHRAEGSTRELLLKQKQIEVAMQERLRVEEQLRVTLQSIGDAVISTDLEGRITFLNLVAAEITGWRQQEAKGRPLIDVFNIVNEQTHRTVENPALRVLNEGIIVGLANHTLLISKDGKERPIDESAAPIRDATGTIFGAVLVFRDVTAKRLAESKLRENERRTRLLADVSAALVGSLHYQSILRKVADLTLPMLGDLCCFDILTDVDRIERVAWKHVDPTKDKLYETVRLFVPTLDNENNPISKSLRSGLPELEPEVSDVWLRRISTTPEHLDFLRGLKIHSVLSVPVMIGQQRLGVLTFAYSESGRRHTSDELSLAEEIAYRSALMIENSKLFNQLRDADRKKNEFLAVLAHELRNPLAPITNALELMRTTKGGEEEEVGPLREMMDRQVQQMTHLIDDLLDVARITSGKIVLRKERLDLSEVVKSALETSRPFIDRARHELTVTMPPQVLHVEGDRTRIAQVLSNLLTNSAKYTPDGGRIWLSVNRDDQQAVIRVRDTGIGIPSEMLPLLFEMFTQVDRNLGRSQGGLGIGLALVRRLVEMHDGTVEAHSDGPGKGSEFVVRLPLATDEQNQTECNGEEDAGSIIGNAFSKLRILVVDDNRDTAESLAKLLKHMGNEVCIANDGPSALDAAANFRPNVVLLDIGLPGMSGHDVARRMRQMPEVKDAVLVAQTGWGQDEDKRQSIEAGFTAHLVKPVDAAELRRLLAGLSTKLN
jgi:PAS domain S-box-containing protein